MPRICYLDFDGAVHASDVYVSRDFGIHMQAKGRALFEWAPILEELLAPYPEVGIVLSTTWVAEWGLEFSRDVLPPALGRRIVGATYCAENPPYFDAWPRGKQITSDVLIRRPSHWFAIDDDRSGWPEDALEKLVLTQGASGISTVEAQNHIRKILESWV